MPENYGTYVAPMQQTGGYDPRLLLDVPEDQRLELMKRMGVADTDPQLPHSPALKVKKTGIIYPWLEILANQPDRFVCCDVDGNEDEAVWGPKVVKTTISNRELSIMAQAQALQKKAVENVQAQHKEFEHYTPSVKLDNSNQTQYERQGVTAFKDISILREQLDNEETTDNSTSVSGS